LAGPVQRVDAADFIGLRQEYRARALINLRRREGLSCPIDEDGHPVTFRYDSGGRCHYYTSDGVEVMNAFFPGEDGKSHSMATGTRKLPDASTMDEFWGSSNAPFEMLDVAEDGAPLSQEVHDLARDAKLVHNAEHVSFGGKEVPYPDFNVFDPNDEAGVDHAVQEYIKRHE